MYSKRGGGYCKSVVIVLFLFIVLKLILLMIRSMDILHSVFIKSM